MSEDTLASNQIQNNKIYIKQLTTERKQEEEKFIRFSFRGKSFSNNTSLCYLYSKMKSKKKNNKNFNRE